jgi:methyl-accepting chemotaxis protein
MTRSIHVSVDNLSAGIAQVSQGAQELAQSTIEQSATVEALKVTISELSQKSSSNAMHSQEASDIVSEILRSAEEGRASMNKMTESMEEINAASQSISTVIKAIDDIAFQTNILSLNAAVEAARAGQHGRGFAVVADEVRNLATKSAEAAMDTNDLIADTISKSGAGFDIVRGASDYLNDIVTGVSESTYRLKSIAIATMEQNESIETINEGFVQLSDVVQQNSSTAEESATATEQMMSQVESLRSFVSGFKIDGAPAAAAMPAPQSAVTAGAFSAAPVNNAVAGHPAASSAWKDDESKY